MMHGTKYATTVSLLASLLAASTARAQNAGDAPRGSSCPTGCVPASAGRTQPMSAAERARAHRRAEARRQQREAQALAEAQARATAEQQRIDAARAQAYQDGERAARERAEQERLNAQRQAQLALRNKDAEIARERALRAQTARTAPSARGGGPSYQPYRPRVILGLEGGPSVYNEGGPFSFDDGVGRAVYVGGAWGARAGVEFFRWLSVEGRYLGMFNGGRDDRVGPGVGLLTHSVSGVAQLGLPLRIVRPYVFGGIGGYWTNVTGGDVQRQASTLTNNASVGAPMGVGLDVAVHENLLIGGEATYHLLLDENFARNPLYRPGDITTFNGVIKLRL